MSKLSQQQMIKIEKQSLFRFSEGERECFQTELETLLAFVEVLDNISDEEPSLEGRTQGAFCSGSKEVVCYLREDDFGQEQDRDALLSNAPQKRDGMFIVPSTISGIEE